MSALGLVIHRFWTKYIPDPHDAAKRIGEDWVEYGPLSGLDRSRCREKVKNLSKLQPLEGSTNPAIVMAHARWNEIRPAYEAWRQGREMPLNGTPLAAWNALQPEQADLLRSLGFKTVESIAEMTDGTMPHGKIPDLPSLIRQARAFVEAAEQNRVAAKLTEKDNEIAALRAESAESAEQIRALMRKVDELATLAVARVEPEGDQPKKSGRPRKVEAA